MFINIIFIALTALVSVVIYRIFLSPLARARVPGPRIAAVTGLYELYYDLCLGGRFPWKLKQLHEQYGRIVRIAPDQVHIDDPDFVTTFFSSRALRDRYGPHQRQLGVPRATIGTLEYDVHRQRRARLAPALSSKRVNGPVISKLIRSKLELVDNHLINARDTGSILDLRLLFWCLMTDIVSELTFRDGHKLLNDHTLDSTIKDFQEAGQGMFHWFKHFPFLWTVLKAIPPRWMMAMEPKTRRLIEWELRQRKRVADALARRNESTHAGPTTGTPTEQPLDFCIYEHLIFSSALPEQDLHFDRVWEESASLLGAGVATISNVLCIILFHLLDSPETWKLLKKELRTASSKASPAAIPTIPELLSLPYFNAVLNEGLRLSFGLTQRIVRVAPHETVSYRQYHLPPGTGVGMSSMLTHLNPHEFHDPERWRPERWLPDEDALADRRTAANRDLLITFGKGPRQCLGIHLAHSEISSTLALMVLKYDFELYRTTRRDVEPRRDQLLPVVAEGSQGVRVRVLS